MTRRALHQVLSGFADGDAISHQALAIRAIVRGWGWDSDLFVEEGHISPTMRDQCRLLADYRGAVGEVLLHHYAIASPAQDTFLQAPAHRIMVYHNITPDHYFRAFDDKVTRQLQQARHRLPEVARRAEACWAVSRFNAAELEALGVPKVHVFPLLFSSQHLDRPPDSRVLDKFRTPLTTWLWVGRLAPNKRLETLIEAFYWYHKTINAQSRLVLVGSERSCPRYSAMLRMLVGDFDLANVCFEGFASPEGLPSYYRSASVYVSTSDHEGFCLPLLEAMHGGVPVVAQEVGGVPEAMAGAGVLYRDLSPAEIAALVHRVLSDPALKNEVLASQEKRMEQERQRDLNAELRLLLTDHLADARP